MIGSYSVNTTVAVNGVIPFSSTYLQKGCTTTLSGTGSFQLNKAGIYHISGYIIATVSASGTVIIDMTKNGVVQTQDNITIEGAVATSPIVVPIDTFVQVSNNNTCCCNTSPTVIQFLNDSEVAITVDSKLNITKLC